MKRLLILLCTFALMLTACSENPSTNESVSSQDSVATTEVSSEYDPFAKTDDSISSETVGSFSAGVEWEDGKELILDYAPTVSFPYYIDNSGAHADFGLLIFVNGIRQPYRTDNNAESKIMHIFDVKQNEHKVQNISFEPVIGDIGDEVSVEIVTMFHPDFIQTESCVYEFNHRISSLYPSSLVVTEETGLSEIEVCSEK